MSSIRLSRLHEYREWAQAKAKGLPAEEEALEKLLAKVQRDGDSDDTDEVLFYLFSAYAHAGERAKALETLPRMSEAATSDVYYCHRIAEGLFLNLNDGRLADEYVERGLCLLAGEADEYRAAYWGFLLRSIRLAVATRTDPCGSEVDTVLADLFAAASRYRFPVYDEALLQGLRAIVARGCGTDPLRPLLEMMWGDAAVRAKWHQGGADRLRGIEELRALA